MGKSDMTPTIPLLLVGELRAASLGVEVLVPTQQSVPIVPPYHRPSGPAGFPSPLVRPVDDEVPEEGGDRPVEDLGVEAPPRVEDGVVGRAGERVLPVGGETEGDDALLGLAACSRCVSCCPDGGSRKVQSLGVRGAAAGSSTIDGRCVGTSHSIRG